MNQFTYFLLPSGWSDEADAPCSVLLRCAVQHGGICQVCRGRWAHLTSSLLSKTFMNEMLKGLEEISIAQAAFVVLISFNPMVNRWVNESFWYGIWLQLALAIVLHKKWHLSVDYTLTSPHVREGSHRGLRQWETRQGRSRKITIDDAGDWGKKRISVCPPLCHPHLGDHITNRAFLKRFFSRGTKWGLSAINKAVWRQRVILKKSKALAGMAIILPRLLESDKGAGPCRKGCSAPGQLNLTDIPPTGTQCRVISSANGQNQNISGSIWSLSDTVHVEEQLRG